MKHLSIDIETYSSENLAKCGVYRYCQSPDFEILVNNKDVQAVSYNNGKKRIGESHGCAKLTAEDVKIIRELRGQKTTTELSKMFGVAQCTISSIQLHKTWKVVM